MTQTRNVNLRLTEENHARWLAAAKAEGRTLTGLVKWAVERYVRGVNETFCTCGGRQAVLTAERFGENQAAAELHATGEPMCAAPAGGPRDWSRFAPGDVVVGTPQDFDLDVPVDHGEPWVGRVTGARDGEMTIETEGDERLSRGTMTGEELRHENAIIRGVNDCRQAAEAEEGDDVQAEAPSAQVVDLMAALKASLAAGQGRK